LLNLPLLIDFLSTQDFEVTKKPNVMTVPLNFEDLIDQFHVEGGATVTMEELPAVVIPWDHWDAPPLPTVDTQISMDQPFRFAVRWQQSGPLSGVFNPDAYWQIEVLLEKMGVEEYELPENIRIHREDYEPVNGHVYEAEFEVPRRPAGMTPGVYRPKHESSHIFLYCF
jgi:hypothetical protein